MSTREARGRKAKVWRTKEGRYRNGKQELEEAELDKGSKEQALGEGHSKEEQSDQQHDNHKRVREAKKQLYIMYVGFFGGLFASIMTYIVHAFGFIPFGPGVIWQHFPSFQSFQWLHGPWGHVISIILLSLLSIAIAYLYYGFFRRMDTPWLGIWFGLTLWAIMFLAVNPFFEARTVKELGFTTNTTFICIFIVYGLFVGYSISYQYLSDQIEKDRTEHG